MKNTSRKEKEKQGECKKVLFYILLEDKPAERGGSERPWRMNEMPEI